MAETLVKTIQAEIRIGTHRFTLHAGERMIERHIAVEDVKEALLSRIAEIIEDYPNDLRGSSFLVLGITKNGRLLHIQCTYPPNIAVITAYEPDPDEWLNGRIRREKRL